MPDNPDRFEMKHYDCVGQALSGLDTIRQASRRPDLQVCALRVSLAFVMVMISVFSGCAAGSAMSEPVKAKAALEELAQHQQTDLTSYAALLRVKMQQEGRISDFRAEVFAEGDSLLSVFVRGFLGKSAFKALLRGDSLLVYFPSERKFFSGWRHGIETGKLRESRHIVDYLLTLLRGYAIVPDSDQWLSDVSGKGSRMRILADDREQLCKLRIDLSADHEKFPYQRLRTLELRSTNDKLRITLQAQSSHYNRHIPTEKFNIDLPPATVQINKDDLVEMLTGMTP